MFKHPNSTSQRSALSLKFNFEVNLFEQSRRVSQARRRLEKERLEGSFVVCSLAIIQLPKYSTETKDGPSDGKLENNVCSTSAVAQVWW